MTEYLKKALGWVPQFPNLITAVVCTAICVVFDIGALLLLGADSSDSVAEEVLKILVTTGSLSLTVIDGVVLVKSIHSQATNTESTKLLGEAAHSSLTVEDFTEI